MARWPRARTLISKPCSPTVPTLPAPFTTMPRMTNTAAISSPWCSGRGRRRSRAIARRGHRAAHRAGAARRRPRQGRSGHRRQERRRRLPARPRRRRQRHGIAGTRHGRRRRVHFLGHLRRGRSHLREPDLRPDRRHIRLCRLHRHYRRSPAPSTVRASSTPVAPPSAWITTNWPSWPSHQAGANGITLVPYFDGERRRTARMPPPPSPSMTPGQHHTREPGPRLRRRTAVLPARLPGAHPIPGRKASRAFCSSAAARSPKLSARWHQAFWAWT